MAGYFDPQNFDPKSKDLWNLYKQQAAGAVQGINRMPFVFGGQHPNPTPSYDQLTPMAPENIWSSLYGGQGWGTAAPAAPAPTSLQSLLGLLNAGDPGSTLTPQQAAAAWGAATGLDNSMLLANGNRAIG